MTRPTRVAQPNYMLLLGLAAAVTLSPACSSDPETSETPEPTPTQANPTPTPEGTPTEPGEFVSALSGGGQGGGDFESGAPSEDSGGEGGGEERAVEEADIIAQVGEQLYVLNTYRGLQILNVSDPDDPQLQGRLPMVGYPVEMYVRGNRAYVVVSDYYSYWPAIDVAGSGAAESTAGSFRGSAVAIVDVSDPNNPTLMGRINLEGYVSQTRAVGEVIYATSVRYAWYDCGGTTTDNTTMTYVTSIDISDPTAPTQIDTLEWEGTGSQIHATSDTLFVTETWYEYDNPAEEEPAGDDEGDTPDQPPAQGAGSSSGSAEDPAPPDESTPTEGGDQTPRSDEPSDPVEPAPPQGGPSYYRTRVTIVDISDPGGLIVERGTANVEGATWDKFALDAYDGTFRIVTQKWDGVTSGTLSVLDITDPDQPELMSSLDIVLPLLEQVTATRFDGDRGYIVTAERTDPLFVVDLTDPSAPRLAGEVEMPGQLDHLETRGDRLIAFGMDNTNPETWLFAVSLFDVSDMDAPQMLDRETVGPGTYSWSTATWDDKSFSVLDDEGLIAVPFQAWNQNWTEYFGGVQLLDFDSTSVTLRGTVTHDGYVRRVRDIENRLYSLSDTDLIVIDATDRDNPAITAKRTIAQNVVDYLPGETYGVQLVTGGWYYSGDAPPGALRVVPAGQPDSNAPAIGEVSLQLNDGQLFSAGEGLVGVVSTSYDASWVAHSTLSVYDISTPATPALVSSLELPAAVWSYASAYGDYYGSSGGKLVQSGDTLAYLETTYYYYGAPGSEVDQTEPDSGDSGGGSGGSGEETSPTPKPRQAAEEPVTQMHVIDLSDPTAPSVVSLDFDQSLYGLWADGDRLYATHAIMLDDSYPYNARYFVDIIDVSDPGAPVVQTPINVPGTAVATIDGGDTLLTLDKQWAETSEGYLYEIASLNTVDITGPRAARLSQETLDGYVYSIFANSTAAYALSQPYWFDAPSTSYSCWYGTGMNLVSVNLTDREDIGTSDTQAVPIYYGTLRAQEGGRLFIDGYSGGLLMYDVLTDPATPGYVDFIRTSGWALHVRVGGTRAYMPAGMYGVFEADLQ